MRERKGVRRDRRVNALSDEDMVVVLVADNLLYLFFFLAGGCEGKICLG